MPVALILVTTEDHLVQVDAIRIVENQLSNCKLSLSINFLYQNVYFHPLALTISSCSYHVPRSWLQPSSNTLVLFEEMGGDPTQISIATREIGSICSQISETHPIPLDTRVSDEETRKRTKPTLSLHCPFPNQIISEIKFASFGTPKGECGSFSHGECSSKEVLSTVKKVLLLTDSFCPFHDYWIF